MHLNVIRPMRRALALVGVLACGLLAAVPALAAGGGREVERELSFSLPVEGFSVGVFVSNNDGDVAANLFVRRGSRFAYYSTPARVTAERVTARFGSLGRLDFHFAPKPLGTVSCDGAEEGEAVFEGSFDFSGENGYVQIQADHAEGSFQVYPEPKGCAPQRRAALRRAPRQPLARRVVPYHPSYSDAGATLGARAGSPAGGSVRELFVADPGRPGRHTILLYAALAEGREGMTVARGVQMQVRGGAFRWNLERGTATLHPPAPFSGAATFTRHGHRGHGAWRGSLAMPILGGGRVRLAGRGFRAFIHRGVPQDE